MFRPNMTDLHHLSLTANNISAKLTNQCTQSGLSTFDWQLPFTWLWWWLPLRLSKHQSPLPTTFLLRTTLTRTIKLHYYMEVPLMLVRARLAWDLFSLVYCEFVCPITGCKLALYSGILSLGIGDTMASVVGKRFGRCRWPGEYLKTS